MIQTYSPDTVNTPLKRTALFGVFVVFLLIFGLGNYLRFMPPVVVAALTLVLLGGYVVLRPIVPYKSASLLAGLALVYSALSWLQIFPLSWTVFHDSDVILRQMYGWVLLPVVAGLSYLWWRLYTEQQRPTWWLWGLLLACVLGPIVLGFVLPALHVVPEPSFRLFRGLNNHSLVAFALFACFVFSLKPIHGVLACFAMLGVCMVFYGNAQNPIVLGYLLLLVMVQGFSAVWLKLGFWATLGMITLYYLYGWINLYTIWDFDANTAVRLVFINNILTSVSDTLGFGVGFGTEAIRNFFAQIDTDFVDLNDPTINFIMIGPHNTFFEAMFRLGIMGFILFGMFFYALTKPVHNPANQALHYALCFGCFVTLWVNNTLLTPTEFFGFAFVVGLIKLIQGTDKPVRDLVRWKGTHHDA